MNRSVDLFDSTYSHFEAEVLARIRQKTFGEDFGQNSWTTASVTWGSRASSPSCID